jgi:hypothetical protein
MIGTWPRSGPEPLGHLEALHVGEHHVEHHHLRAEALHRRERVAASAG